jgi:acyl-CoA reductase-like NAD-dependent aldehyde dehydrogenase
MSIDPATGEVWRHWPAISDAQVVAAVPRARAAQPEWSARSLGDRRRILRRFRHLLFKRRAEIASLIEREAGKPAVEAMVVRLRRGARAQH